MAWILDPIDSTTSLGVARWDVLTPPTYRPVTRTQAEDHLRTQAGESAEFWNLLIDAATRHAEEAMNVCLCAQTIAAVFNAGEPMRLPRGPLIAVTSVADATGASAGPYTLSHAGHATTVTLTRGARFPATVVYRAGYVGPPPTYAETPDAIPADIRIAILAHVGTLYDARESTTDKPRTAVPHSLDAFYARRNRGKGVA